MRDEAIALARRARAQLAQTRGKPLESNVLRGALRDHLEAAGTQASMHEVLRESTAAPSAAVAVATSDVAAAAGRAMEKVDSGQASNLTEFEFVSLEAIVQLTGRPAMRYTDGRVGMPPNDLGENDRWRTFVAVARSKINNTSASVGQVAIVTGGASAPIGTAWRLGDDLVVTNRHVAAALVSSRTLPPAEWTLDLATQSIVDFNVTDAATTQRRFAVTALLYCADEDSVDMAVLRIDGAGAVLPPPLKLDFAAESVGRDIDNGGATTFQGEEIYIVGHPFRQFASSQSAAVFGNADAFKRCSPGLVTLIPQREHAFEHDCSTLGGNSGSCVLSVSGHKVVGLHYGGAEVNQMTGIGRANLALGLARLGDHRAAAILREGRVP